MRRRRYSINSPRSGLRTSRRALQRERPNGHARRPCTNIRHTHQIGSLSMSDHSTTDLRLTELLAALSVATDLGMGQPLEFAMQSCALALRLGRAARLRRARAARHLRPSAAAAISVATPRRACHRGGVRRRAGSARHSIDQDPRDPRYLGTLVRFIREANAGASPLRLAQAVVGGLTQTSRQLVVFRRALRGGRPPGRALGPRRRDDRGDPAAGLRALGRQGHPRAGRRADRPRHAGGLAGSGCRLRLPAGRGQAAAGALAQQRKGTLYAPKHVEVFVRHAGALLAGISC